MGRPNRDRNRHSQRAHFHHKGIEQAVFRFLIDTYPEFLWAKCGIKDDIEYALHGTSLAEDRKRFATEEFNYYTYNRENLLELEESILRDSEKGSEFEFDEIPGFDMRMHLFKNYGIILKPIKEDLKTGTLDGKVYKKTRYRVL